MLVEINSALRARHPLLMNYALSKEMCLPQLRINFVNLLEQFLFKVEALV